VSPPGYRCLLCAYQLPGGFGKMIHRRPNHPFRSSTRASSCASPPPGSRDRTDDNIQMRFAAPNYRALAPRVVRGADGGFAGGGFAGLPVCRLAGLRGACVWVWQPPLRALRACGGSGFHRFGALCARWRAGFSGGGCSRGGWVGLPREGAVPREGPGPSCIGVADDQEDPRSIAFEPYGLGTECRGLAHGLTLPPAWPTASSPLNRVPGCHR
jgi:hypothetical protein